MIVANSAFIALGSNLEDPPERLMDALAAILIHPSVGLVRWSSIYETKPWGYVDQPDFCDAVCQIETDLAPMELLRVMQQLEVELGRAPVEVKWGPRRIDMDLLLYGERVVHEPSLDIPHPLMREREFVLAPLVEIAPELCDPVSGEKYADDLQRVQQPGDVVRILPPPELSALQERATFSLLSHSPEETANLGAAIASLSPGNMSVALIGPLGAGKTHLTQGLARGLGIGEPITSPTFLLHKAYDGAIRLHHFDFYRLESEDDLESIGFFDFQAQDVSAVVVVEWAEKFLDALEPPVLIITISPQPDESRRIKIRGREVSVEWLRQLRQKVAAQ